MVLLQYAWSETTNQRKEEGFSAVNDARVSSGQTYGGEKSYHYRKTVYPFSSVAMLTS